MLLQRIPTFIQFTECYANYTHQRVAAAFVGLPAYLLTAVTVQAQLGEEAHSFFVIVERAFRFYHFPLSRSIQQGTRRHTHQNDSVAH